VNLLFSCIGRRGYIARLFREHLAPGDRIIGTSNTRWTSGFNSCDAGYLMPDIYDPAYPDAVLDLCAREKVGAVLSFFDPDVHRLSRLVDAFRGIGVKPFLPGPAAADVSFDKVRTYEFLVANGFRTARTFSDLASVRSALRNRELCFPLYVKPRFGFGSRNTFRATDEGQLRVFFGLEPDMIVQDVLGGVAYDFDMLNDLEGRVVSVVPWRKSLSRMGETEEAETVTSPLLLELGVNLGTRLAHAGALDADLFVDDQGASVLEINLRFGGGYPVSHLAGAGFPQMVIRMARGETVSPVIGRYRSGVVMMKELHVIGGDAGGFFDQQLKVRAHPAATPP
jgi:carbamoyl-phosphate synthase large subunit